MTAKNSPSDGSRQGGGIAQWLRGPWVQLVIYLLIFLVLGFAVSAFFNWLRGPDRSQYIPWETSGPSIIVVWTSRLPF
jgi:hypothetical protein